MVLAALSLGLRHIDTAEAYQNEAEIGQRLHALFTFKLTLYVMIQRSVSAEFFEL